MQHALRPRCAAADAILIRYTPKGGTAETGEIVLTAGPSISESRGAIGAHDEASSLADWYTAVRSQSRRVVEPFSPEDCCVQSMPSASPAKWHLAHTTWFFETFVLKAHLPGYTAFDERFCFLFNSYYNAVGEQFERPRRGTLTRPSLADVEAYRDEVDRQMARLLPDAGAEVRTLTEIGLHHEMQHQELMVADFKHLMWSNPLRPAIAADPPAAAPERAQRWHAFEGGVCEIGHQPRPEGFAYDNESPRHRVFLEPFEIADRVVTNAEYLEFIADGGYRRSELWLDAGWCMVREHRWSAPLYWSERDGQRFEFTAWGDRALDPHAPLAHVSYFEADAFARWSDAALPTEGEWEHAAMALLEDECEWDVLRGESAVSGVHPRPRRGAGFMGGLWEWTSSHYSPYPGYRAADGALGEYNGKFMCGPFVLRGGSCATPAGHLRPSYRNFWDPGNRHQFSGLRLLRRSGS